MYAPTLEGALKLNWASLVCPEAMMIPETLCEALVAPVLSWMFRVIVTFMLTVVELLFK